MPDNNYANAGVDLNKNPDPNPNYNSNPNPNYNYNPNPVENIPEAYRPISMWGYFGYELLFALPIVGFILLLVFAFGGSNNINLRNFARSKFCYWIILVALVLLLFILALSMGGLAVFLDSMY